MRPMPDPAFITFDFDGVLVDSVHVKTEAFGELYRHHGPDIEAAVVEHHCANQGQSRYEKIRYYETELLSGAADDELVEERAQQFSELVESKVIACDPIPGAVEFLSAAAGELPMAVASATPTEELRRIVDARRMSHFFVSVHGAPASKADAMRDSYGRFGIESRQAIMVGDTAADYEAARQTGTPFVGVKGPFPGECVVIDDLRDLSTAIADALRA